MNVDELRRSNESACYCVTHQAAWYRATCERHAQWGPCATGPASLPAFAWPGGYPIWYYSAEGDVFCASCANQSDASPDIIGGDVAYEGPAEYCSGCNATLETAYGDSDEPEEANS